MECLAPGLLSVINTSPMCNQSEQMSPATIAEFDVGSVLCRVCGDRASGFHYGVHACEGCKGFFRRSIQQKIQYRPCVTSHQCNIQRVNRNRCQYCRLNKCISLGMSRDAVRFGRVPKKEKARVIEQMEKKNLTFQSNQLNSLLANDLHIVSAVVASHRRTCDITRLHAHKLHELALHSQNYVSCPANVACPLNNEIGMDMNANLKNLNNVSESFTPAIRAVVDFAKGIPGFTKLSQDDQVTLLKTGTFEVLLVRLTCLFDSHSKTMMFTSGKLYKRQQANMATKSGFLLDSMFDFAETFNKMCLSEEEIAVFSAVVLVSPDRPGLRNVNHVEKIQIKLTEVLKNIVNINHKADVALFAKLLVKTTEVRTLNTLHSEKLLAEQRNNERNAKQNIDESEMEYQDSLNTRSVRSSSTLSETYSMTMASAYHSDADNNNPDVGQHLSPAQSSHQQVVLRTPYGMFFREETCGIYGMMADQPRRRSNTMDRDTLTRTRLHTIEEGNRRRNTLDRDYINKMVNRSCPDSLIQENYNNMRRRCYSFHLDSQSRTSCMSYQHQKLGIDHGQYLGSRMSYNKNKYLSPEIRRSSVGSTFDLNRPRQFLWMNSPMSCRTSEGLETRTRGHVLQDFKHIIPYGSLGDMHLTSESLTKPPTQWTSQAASLAQPLPVPTQHWYQKNVAQSEGYRSHDWNIDKILTRGMSQNVVHNDFRKNISGKTLSNCPKLTTKESSNTHIKISPMNAEIVRRQVDKPGIVPAKGYFSPAQANPGVAKDSLKLTKPSAFNSLGYNKESEIVMSRSSSPEDKLSYLESHGSEDYSTEVFGHKKFDRCRKDKAQVDPITLTRTEDFSAVLNNEQKKNWQVTEERMEANENKEDTPTMNNSIKENSNIKEEQILSYIENSTSYSSSDQLKRSAKETHPNLLAHLVNGGGGSVKMPPTCLPIATNTTLSSAGIQTVIPCSVAEHSNDTTHPNLQAYIFNNALLPCQNTFLSAIEPLLTLEASISQPASVTPQNISSTVSSTSANILDQPSCDLNERSVHTDKEFYVASLCCFQENIQHQSERTDKLKKVDNRLSIPVNSSRKQDPIFVASDSFHWPNSSPPILEAAPFNTTDLNKELATKLTISKSASPSTTTTLTSNPSSPPKTHKVYCPFLSQSVSTTSSTATVLSASASFSHSGLSTSNTPETASAPHIRVSSEVHPTTLQMYHSMRGQQYLTLKNPSGAFSSLPANTPHFSGLFVQCSLTQQSGNDESKRFELG